ncbi:hypothetical protein AAC387_Pa05g0596 [Persea americana]
MAAKQMSLTLLVDKERNRVIYAESGKDFVETLLSFLTLPLGTVIKLSGKQSNMGSLTKLYESLEDLDSEFLNTKACKDMLLHPKSPAEELYKYLPLIVNIGAIYRTKYYVCSCSLDWCVGTHRLISVVSSMKSFALLKKFGVSDTSVLEEMNVNVGEEEVLYLLKRLLLSKTPLTDVFLGELNVDDGIEEQAPSPVAFSRAMRSIQLSTMNQKFPYTVTGLGGSFVAGPAMFMRNELCAWGKKRPCLC